MQIKNRAEYLKHLNTWSSPLASRWGPGKASGVMHERHMNLLETVWKRATRTSGDLHSKTYEEKLTNLKLFSSVKRKSKWRETAIFLNVKGCCRVERIPLIFCLMEIALVVGQATCWGKEKKLSGLVVILWFHENFFQLWCILSFSLQTLSH